MDVSREIESVTLVSPVRRGDAALKNVLGTGIDIIVTRDM
jgi:CxxC motif-containing protein